MRRAWTSPDLHQCPQPCLPGPVTCRSLHPLPPGFIKVLLYMAFMTIMIKVHTFPLFAIRPMYLAMR